MSESGPYGPLMCVCFCLQAILVQHLITDNLDVECNFEEMYFTKRALLKIHNIDLLTRQIPTQIPSALYLNYQNNARVNQLFDDYPGVCSQALEYLCLPWIKDISNLDQNKRNAKDGASYSDTCHCVRHTYSMRGSE